MPLIILVAKDSRNRAGQASNQEQDIVSQMQPSLSAFVRLNGTQRTIRQKVPMDFNFPGEREV
jgi:hypothetical protein